MMQSEMPYELGDKLPMSRDSYMTLETETKTAIANGAWFQGRASRDGLRKALEKVLKAGNLAWAWEEAKEALEADWEGK